MSESATKFHRVSEALIFNNRKFILMIFAVLTVFMFFMATQLKVDAGFKKQLPLSHEFMQTFLDYESDFGGANRLLVALIDEDGDMFDAQYFKALEDLTNEIFFIPGVDRAKVRSIFTPNVRFVEVVEDGFAGGNVIPADFAPQASNFNPTVEDFDIIRSNIVKAGVVGRLVAENFDGAMVWAELLERDPSTGEKLDYQDVAAKLEVIRSKFEKEGMSVHIIGFAKIVGDVAEGAKSVVGFFGIAIVITGILLFLYCRTMRLTLLPLVCSLVAVVWQLGSLPLMGKGMDPMNILTPFLIFAIGVSHGVQMINSWKNQMMCACDGHPDHCSGLNAAKTTFILLLVPGSIALLSDTIGFLTIWLIDIKIIQELAITASVGVAIVIFTNLILMPILLSFITIKNADAYRKKRWARKQREEKEWKILAKFTQKNVSIVAIIAGAVLLGFGLIKGENLQIGDSQEGVPELRQNSRYNEDARLITQRFSLGVDQISIIVETTGDACTERYEVLEDIDRMAWNLRNVEGVQRVISYPGVIKIVNAGWNEGFFKWRVISRNNYVLRQSIGSVDTDTGLRNGDCSGMPIIVFTKDHRAETITRVVSAVEEFAAQSTIDDLKYRLATGPVGVMAATNEVVAAAQKPMLLWVYGAIIILCLLTFRSIGATICIVTPLVIVSALAYALMTYLGIGLKVNTLPVVALGVGIGVDYGIYIYSKLAELLKGGASLHDAYLEALRQTGKPVLFTAVTLAVGVSTWLFSTLQFQADMGVLLTFMFLLNMVGAIVLVPALARWLLPKKQRNVT